ncbi:hypothetical protein MYVALT_F_00320 [Candidatus Vallotia tarda]|uniref:Uncharacterized protein n=1 Tax=Candidatus Vallotiella hemipterorum TaxID=1177213 RepID=A0A916JUA7_9BURK|nr:hypothetical protein MYVALT_F_00320 [Candidatus Vallotia tarda]
MFALKKVIAQKKSASAEKSTIKSTIKKPILSQETLIKKSSPEKRAPIIQPNTTTVQTTLNPTAAWPFPTGSHP